jgi:hypothetical protein
MNSFRNDNFGLQRVFVANFVANFARGNAVTILYSFYTAEGIVFAADSRITTTTGQALPEQRKVLRVPRTGVTTALIGYYGLAQVQGQSMTSWLRNRIAAWQGSHDPADFATVVADGLTRDARGPERSEVSGLHLGAFRSSNGHVEPVFYHIRNTRHFNPNTGAHFGLIGNWVFDEQLMARDAIIQNWQAGHIQNHLRTQARTGVPLWYRNGDLPLFGQITGLLEAAIHGVCQLRGYRAPITLDGWTRIARTHVITTSQIAVALCAATPTVGGTAAVLGLPWP